MLKLFRKLSRGEWLLAVCSMVFIVLQVWLELTMPDYMREITTLIQTPGSGMEDILKSGGMMLLCALGSLVCSILTAICAARIASGFGASLRSRLFRKVQSFSIGEISRFSTASLITRSTNDVTQVQMLIVMGLQVIIRAPIMAVWAMTKIKNQSAPWTIATGTSIVLLLLLTFFGVLVALPKFRKLQTLTDDINRITREELSGLPVVRAYNAEGYQQRKFDTANDVLTRTSLFTARTMGLLMPLIMLIMNGLSLAIYWLGADLINQAGIFARIGLFSDMVVYLSYAMQIVMSFMMLVMIFILLPRATVSARRINEVLDTVPAVAAPKDGRVGTEKGSIIFRHVSFRYPDAAEDVLHDIDFQARSGETVALIGATGCGKTSVVNLIPRFFDTSEGQVLVDGVDVREWDLRELRNRIGYVSQKATLFRGTIESNVRYGDNGRGEPAEADVLAALDTAQATEFVEEREDGIAAHVSQGGSNLSGGQKQRLSIARAVARNPEILIFDDSFSALDYRTDRNVRQALKERCADATKLIVAQRIGTIRDADRIIVLDNGAVAGIGTHQELMTQCETYRQIAYSQLSKEELQDAR